MPPAIEMLVSNRRRSGASAPPVGTPTKPRAPPGRTLRSAWSMDSLVPTHSSTESARTPPEQFADLGDAVVAAFCDDVRGAELAGDRLAVGVPGHGDDPLRAEALGGEHATE